MFLVVDYFGKKIYPCEKIIEDSVDIADENGVLDFSSSGAYELGDEVAVAGNYLPFICNCSGASMPATLCLGVTEFLAGGDLSFFHVEGEPLPSGIITYTKWTTPREVGYDADPSLLFWKQTSPPAIPHTLQFSPITCSGDTLSLWVASGITSFYVAHYSKACSDPYGDWVLGDHDEIPFGGFWPPTLRMADCALLTTIVPSTTPVLTTGEHTTAPHSTIAHTTLAHTTIVHSTIAHTTQEHTEEHTPEHTPEHTTEHTAEHTTEEHSSIPPTTLAHTTLQHSTLSPASTPLTTPTLTTPPPYEQEPNWCAVTVTYYENPDCTGEILGSENMVIEGPIVADYCDIYLGYVEVISCWTYWEDAQCVATSECYDWHVTLYEEFEGTVNCDNAPVLQCLYGAPTPYPETEICYDIGGVDSWHRVDAPNSPHAWRWEAELAALEYTPCV